ncbi:MAG: hypothetical protein CL609_04690 [Anaerolineaceae bacterium]|nr:hypothetical protein [Anaerolineaceae bacterium]
MKQDKYLTGLSAGKLCLFPQKSIDPITVAAFQAAKNLGNSNRGKWILTEIWQDGTTLWRSPNRTQQALVSVDGFMNFLFIPDQNEW